MKKIQVDVFDFTVYLANGYNFEDFVKEVCDITKLTPDLFQKNPLAVYHFWNSDFDKELRKMCFLYSEEVLIAVDSELPKIIHEITHIKNVIFAYRGMKSESGNDEHEACLNEFLMKRILEEL
jgi:hypothetical protein